MMRRKKYLIVLVSFVFLLFIGVGFAVVSENLSISGSTTSSDEETLSSNYDVIFVQFHTITDTTKQYKYFITEGNVSNSSTSSTESGVKATYKMVTKGDSVNLGMDLENLSVEYGSKITYSILVDGVIFSLSGVTYSNIDQETITVDIDEFYRVHVNISSLDLAVCNKTDSQTNNIAEVSLKVEMIKTPTKDLVPKSISLDIHTEAVEIK